MSVPALDLSGWQEDPNNSIAAQGTNIATAKRMWRTLKTRMLAFAANPPVIKAMCDGTTAGSLAANGGLGDGTDRWTTDANIVWNNAGSAHSWGVFRFAAAGIELLISMENADADGNRITMYWSTAGFTGGSTTARPTATDEVPLVTNAAPSFLNATFRLHLWLSNDGKHFRVLVYSAGVLVFTIMLGVPKAAPVIPAGWTNPYWGYVAAGANALNYDALCQVAAGPLKARAAGVTMALFCTAEGWGITTFPGVARLTGPNALTSSPAEYPLPPIGLASETATCEGRHAAIADLWWGLTNQATNTNYPEDVSKIRTQFGDVVFPTPSGATYALT